MNKIKFFMLRFVKSIKSVNLKFFIWSVLGTFLGLYLAEGLKNIENFIFGIIGVLVAIGVSSYCVDESIHRYALHSGKTYYESKNSRYKNPETRLACYFLSICVLYAVSAFAVFIGSAGRDVGEEEATGKVVTEAVPPAPYYKQRQWLQDAFIAMFVPSLIGVRLALGQPKEDSYVKSE